MGVGRAELRSERISRPEHVPPRTDPAPTRTELGSGVRVELTSVVKHDRDSSGYQDSGNFIREILWN